MTLSLSLSDKIILEQLIPKAKNNYCDIDISLFISPRHYHASQTIYPHYIYLQYNSEGKCEIQKYIKQSRFFHAGDTGPDTPFGIKLTFTQVIHVYGPVSPA